MMARITALGSMTNTARTALVESSPGMIMPYFCAISIDTSSMSGNVTSTSRMSRNAILSLMVRSHAMWL